MFARNALRVRAVTTSKQAFKMPSGAVSRLQSTTAVPTDQEATAGARPSQFANRMKVTAEVMVSKIFPAGFGWQYGSCLAGDMGFEPTDLGFFLSTGLGDLTGVFLGHSVYFALKSAIVNYMKLGEEVGTGLFLGSAAFFSGFAWQPTVNLLQAASLPWLGVAGGTWAVCGLAFYGGLRLGRLAYSPLGLVAGPNYTNVKTDAALSVSIGGATGAFVGTDVAYLPDQNPLINVVGVTAEDSVLAGSVKAGSSTALGFAGAQVAQNVVYSKGKNWTD